MADWRKDPVTVRVPATSANLGPGFDALGLALGLHDTVHAAVVPAGVEVAVAGAGAGHLSLGEDHLVIRAMRAAFTLTGEQPPGIAISCRNQIPQGFGLGSSAAAIVSGVLAARALAGEQGSAALPDDAVLRLAAEIEGHPDNVAACLHGGLTITWPAAGGPDAVRLTTLPELAPVLCVPAVPLATEAARRALPVHVSHADAAANSARAALLVVALTSRPELLLAGTEDYLHQSYRAAAMPGTALLVARLRDAGIAAVVSGAGPSVLALTVSDSGHGGSDVARIAAADGERWQILPLAVDSGGAEVLPG